MKRAVAFALAAVMVMLSASACKSKKQNNPLSLEEIKELLSGYKVVYSEVRNDKDMEMLRDAAAAVRDAFSLEMVLDTDEAADASADGKEILIGETVREISKNAVKNLSDGRENHYNDFIIKCSENKIIIAGASPVATASAIKYFLETAVKELNADNITDFEYIHQSEIAVTQIAGVDVKNYSICISNEKYLNDFAKRLQNELIVLTGYNIPIVRTNGLKTAAAIYIGADGAKSYDAAIESIKSYRENHMGDWSVKISDKGIAIAGLSESTITEAANYFFDNMLAMLKDGTLTSYDYRKEYATVTINGNDISEYSISAKWNLDKEYAFDDAKKYASWMQEKIADKTGYMLPIDYSATEQVIKINISKTAGVAGQICVEDDNLVIKGGRPASVAGAMDEFVKKISTSIDFTDDEQFSKEFDTAIVVEGLYPPIENVLENSTDKRPVPTKFEIGSEGHRGEDGLVYYPMPDDAETTVSKLTGGTVIMKDTDLFNIPAAGTLNSGNPSEDNYGDYETGGFYTVQNDGNLAEFNVVDVNDDSVNFKKALSVQLKGVPSSNQYVNLRYYPSNAEFSAKFSDGDVMLVKIYAKLISGGDIASATGRVDFSFGKYWASKQESTRGESGTVSLTASEDGWQVYYLAFAPTHQYISDGFCFGINPTSYVQEMLIGGFELINYGKAYTMDDMPSNTNVYAGADENAEWRQEALDRIEEVRKDDINVIVKDADGNVVSGADVKVDMYEHEFDIGLNISHYYPNTDKPNPDKFRETIVENFNSYGTGHLHKKNDDNDLQLEYDVAENCYYWAMLNGCAQELKGHALFWDAETSDPGAIPEHGNQYAGVIDYYMQFINDNDWDGFYKAIEAHFEWMGTRYPYMTQWDVSNEDSSRNAGSLDWSALKKQYIKYLKNKYGSEYAQEHCYDYLLKIYEYAREYFPDAELVVNDIFDYKSSKYQNLQIPFLDWADMNLDFDAIGYQGHEGYNTDPEEVVKILEDLSKYDRPIHITEFDTNSTGGLSVWSGTSGTEEAENYQANLVRDVLIAYFACENVESLYLWWHKDVNGESGRILYDYNYNLKKSGMMFQDLFYNQWWTNEAGTTGADGKFSTRGFYGDYTITVTKDGETVSVDVPCHKGSNNTVVVTLP